jgi:hypothetical protein
LIETLLSIGKPIDAPGSIEFFFLCLGVGLCFWLIWPRSARLARRWLMGVFSLYIVLALPITAKAIAGQLPAMRTDVVWGPVTPVDALVIFDGDNRRGRLRAAAAAYAQSHPRETWVLGSEASWFEPELPPAGIPASAVQFDSSTLNTRDQIAWVGRRIAAQSDLRVAVVASRLQAPRIAGMFRVAGLTTVAIVAAPIDTEPPVSGSALLLPANSALRVSRDALYEHMALAYYRHNGWVRP